MTYISSASPASHRASRMETVGRVLFSSVFVAAGIQHLVATDAVVARLHEARFGHLAATVAPLASCTMSMGRPTSRLGSASERCGTPANTSFCCMSR